MKSLSSLLVAAALAFPGIAQLKAQDSSRAGGATVATATWHFVPTGRLDFAHILPPPPAIGSLANEADLWAVRQSQVWRTSSQVAWAQEIATNNLFEFRTVLGAWFTKQNLPVTAALLYDVDEDLNSAIAGSKKLFARPRPWAEDSALAPCVERPKDKSYPSGHTMSFYTEAGVLSEIFPARRTALMAFAQKMAWGRVIGGVHYPTDLEGGRRVALAVLAELDKSAAFHAALERARAETAPFVQAP